MRLKFLSALARSEPEITKARHCYFIKNANCFIQHIVQTYCIAVEDIAVVAQSVGAVIGAAWVPLLAVLFSTYTRYHAGRYLVLCANSAPLLIFFLTKI